MKLEKAIEIIKKHIDIDKSYRKSEDSDYDKFCDEQVEAMQTLLNELERLQEDNQEWKMMFDVFNEREYRKKYLEEERAKRPKLLYPDADEIYKRYYELKTEIQQLKKGINSLMNSRKKWKDRYYKLKTENSKLKIQNENISRELISRTNAFYGTGD